MERGTQMIQYINNRLRDFKNELDNTTDASHENYLEGIIDAHEHLLEVAIKSNAWVTADGDYGQGDVRQFEPEDLTADQWDDIVNMHENNRYDYVSAILDGDTKTASNIREESFGDV